MPTKYENIHAGAVSRYLELDGFPKSTGAQVPGFRVKQWWHREPYVAAITLRGMKPGTGKKLFTDIAGAMEKRGFVVKFGWDVEGRQSTSILLVSKQPFAAPYEVAESSALPPDADAVLVRESIFTLLTGANHLAADSEMGGFVIHPAEGTKNAVAFVTWSQPLGIMATADYPALDHGRVQLSTYHAVLRKRLPCALLAQDGDPFGCLLVGASWADVADTFQELVKHSWDRVLELNAEPPVTEAEVPAEGKLIYAGSTMVLAGPPQEDVSASLEAVQRSLEGRPVPDEIRADLEVLERALTGIHVPEASPLWEAVRDLFLDTESAAAAVREIGNEHTAARDDAASTMERRLYHQALLAIAAGSPDAQKLAHTVLETQHLFFNRQ